MPPPPPEGQPATSFPARQNRGPTGECSNIRKLSPERGKDLSRASDCRTVSLPPEPRAEAALEPTPSYSMSAMSSEPPPPPQPPTHQASVGLLDTPRSRERSPSPLRGNVVPSPLPTRRTRTFSATVRASQGPVYKGVCKCFCRSKGHGFITPADGGPDIFLHISDVEGEYVPVEGDEVTYKMCSIPPKNEKLQAVEVVITHLAPGTKHETWSGHVISS
ncbi:calcium-regulated heat-stable protein 1 isoform X1 [Gorilla gorilla gorilla]|nr:calcium-regulated heat-stable protein 1 isoform X1 [Gorilla gorilla gorilla]